MSGPHLAGSKPPENGWSRSLSHIKNNDELKTIPTVILTTSNAEADVAKSYELQANCYLTKPVHLEAFEVLVKSINDFWLTKVELPQKG
jgi:chemotaxis family two-component system response regulator Rcp1